MRGPRSVDERHSVRMKLPPNAITTNNLDVGTDFCGVYLLVNLKVLLLDRLWKVGKRGPRSVDERHSVRMKASSECDHDQ